MSRNVCFVLEKSADGLTAVEKLVKANLEIESLQMQIEHQASINARLKAETGEQRKKLDEMDTILENRNYDRIELTSDMSRQYKSMQTELQLKITHLESQVTELKTKLGTIQVSASDSAKELSRIIEEKERIIDEQNTKMTYMSAEFENMMNETLAKMAKKLEIVNQKWKDDIQLSDINQRRLADFNIRVAI